MMRAAPVYYIDCTSLWVSIYIPLLLSDPMVLPSPPPTTTNRVTTIDLSNMIEQLRIERVMSFGVMGEAADVIGGRHGVVGGNGTNHHQGYTVSFARIN